MSTSFRKETIEDTSGYYIGAHVGFIQGCDSPILLDNYIEDLKLALLQQEHVVGKECYDMMRTYCDSNDIAYIDLGTCKGITDLRQKISDRRRVVLQKDGWIHRFGICQFKPPKNSNITALSSGDFMLKAVIGNTKQVSFDIKSVKNSKISVEIDVKIMSGMFRFVLKSTSGAILGEINRGASFEGVFWINVSTISDGDVELQIDLDPVSPGSMLIRDIEIYVLEPSVSLPAASSSSSSSLLSSQFYDPQNDEFYQKYKKAKQIALEFTNGNLQNGDAVLNSIDELMARLHEMRHVLNEERQSELTVDVNKLLNSKINRFVSEVGMGNIDYKINYSDTGVANLCFNAQRPTKKMANALLEFIYNS